MRHAVRALILLALLCAATGARARDRALVIGINEYPLVNGGGSNLGGAVADARSFARALEESFRFDPGDIRMLLDAQATRAAILSGFESWLIAGSRPGDRVVFYFAGHGATQMVKEGNGERPTSTLVAADASFDGPALRNTIEGRQIGQYLRRLDGRRVTVFADSCHSGSVTRGLDRGPSGVRTLTPRVPAGLSQAAMTRDLQSEIKTSAGLLFFVFGMVPRSGALAVWSAAAIDQVTFDLSDRSGGIFTQSFLRGLHELGMDRDSYAATPGALLNNVRDKAADFCRQKEGCVGLTPTLLPDAAIRDLTLAPDPPPPKPDTPHQAAEDAQGLLAHRNDFPLDVAILPGARVRLHDQIRFRVTAGEAGTLVILDAGPDGTLRQIYPNGYGQGRHATGAVRAGAPTTIPDASYGFAFEAADAGTGQLLVLVADRSLDLSGIVGRRLDGKAIADPRGIVVELAEELQKPVVTPDLDKPNGAHRWAFKAVPYRIDP